MANELIGASRVEHDRIEWDTDKVTPLTTQYCETYSREIRRSLSRGELIEVTEAKYLAYLARETPVEAPKSSKRTQEPDK